MSGLQVKRGHGGTRVRGARARVGGGKGGWKKQIYRKFDIMNMKGVFERTYVHVNFFFSS